MREEIRFDTRLLVERARKRESVIALLRITGVFILIAIAYVAISTPFYTATAIIGPTNSVLSAASSISLLNTSGALGALSSLTGASTPDQNQFETYEQVLSSQAIMVHLLKEPNVLKTMFYDKWDDTSNSWDLGLFHLYVEDPIKALLHIPYDYPNLDDVETYMDKYYEVEEISSSKASAVFAGAPAFLQVSFTCDDPRRAEQILVNILAKADEMVREQDRKDVQAQINYFTRLIPTVTAEDERNALIINLSAKEQAMAMIAADQRYAWSIVDPPYAPDTPTKPKLILVGLLTVMAAFFVWLGYLLLPPGWLQTHSRRLIQISAIGGWLKKRRGLARVVGSRPRQ